MSKIIIQWGVSILMVAFAGACWAQGAASYPAKTIRIIITLAPGGGVDTSGRLLGQKFTDAWGQQVVAENRPGAGGTIAAELVARAAPDGYTLLMQSMSHAITPALYKLSYDSIKDFAPISLFVQSPSVLAVHPSLPVKSVKELIAFTKARPNEILFSSSGSGSGQHLAMELLNRMAGLQLVHIPYKGTAPSILDLVAGCDIDHAACPRRPAAGVGSVEREAIPFGAGASHRCRGRSPRICRGPVVRPVCAGRHVERNRRQALRGDRQGRRKFRDQGAVACDGARSGRHAARRVYRVCEDGNG